MDESDHWIEHAIKHHGAFKAEAEKAGKSTKAYAEEKQHEGGVLGHRARLAMTLMHMHHSGSKLDNAKHPASYSTENMPND
jgi:hypothetical protein